MHVGVAVQLVDDGLDHPVQQVLTAGHVPVDGHGFDSQIGRQAPHGQVAQPVHVDVSDSGAQHAGAVKSAAG
jgi:hypothetical protein